jgi:hypothetical protein
MRASPGTRHDGLPDWAATAASWSGSWRPDRDARARITVATAMTAIAGAVHLGVGLRHGPTAHGSLFLAVGATQMALALLVLRRPGRQRLAAVVAINTTVTLAWLLTYTPSGTGRGEITSAGLTATTLQITAALTAVGIRRRRNAGPARRTDARAVALVGAAAVAAAAFGWTGHSHHHDQPAGTTASAEVQPIFDDLFVEHHHSSAADHDDHSEPHGR